MVTSTTKEIELIQRREEYNKEKADGIENAQKTREKMIKRKHKALHGVLPTKEQIKEQSDFIDGVNDRLRTTG